MSDKNEVSNAADNSTKHIGRSLNHNNARATYKPLKTHPNKRRKGDLLMGGISSGGFRPTGRPHNPRYFTSLTQRSFFGAVIFVLVAVILAIIGIVLFLHRPVSVTIDGAEATVSNGSSIAQLVKDKKTEAIYGNLIDVEGVLLKEGEGERYTVSVNGSDLGEEIDNYRVHQGDDIEFTNGVDKTEPYDSQQTEIPYEWEFNKGAGAVMFVKQWGHVGVSEVVTGKLSGKTVDRGVVTEPQNTVVTWHNVHPKDDEKLVAITFDDGPSKYTETFLEILKKYDVKATFFMVGRGVKQFPELAKKVAEAGHQVAGHTMNHPNLTKVSVETLHSELDDSFGLIEQASGVKSKVLRPPYGAFNYEVFKAADSRLTAVVNWNVDSVDWKRPGADAIMANATGHMKPGYIILMHDGGGPREQGIEALPKIIEAWKAAGYRFVTISELLQSDPDIPEDVIKSMAGPNGGVASE